MKTLKGVKIAVGITGCIAAYKCAEVVSRLTKLGADVTVMMTKSSQEFIAPLTFGTLTKNKVICDMFTNFYSKLIFANIIKNSSRCTPFCNYFIK